MARSIRIFLLLILLPICSSVSVLAEDELLWLPDYFERVQELSDVEHGAYYLIAGVSSHDGHVMMTSELVNKKLKGVAFPQHNSILCDDGALVWQVYRSGNEVFLRAAQEGQYLYVPNAKKPEVEIRTAQYTTWELQEKGDGFVLKHPAEKYRYLYTSYYQNKENPNPFGNYYFTEGTVETNVLYFYKLNADNTPPTDNSITYLKDGDDIPSNGNLMVYQGKLLYPSVLLDAIEFNISEPFSVTEGQLTYTRILQDNNWETLCLPFAAQVPQGIDARELVSVANGELIFQPASEIRPHVPVILRSESSTGMSVTFFSKSGMVTPPTQPTNAPFFPLYQQLNVATAAEGIYLLANPGLSFTLADAGSTLRPFRAYIKME